MLLKKQDNLIAITFKYDQRLIDLVRTLENRQYDKEKRIWTIPLVGANGSLKRLLDAGFKISPELKKALKEEKELEIEAGKLGESEQVEFESSLPLLNYQKIGAKFLNKIGSGLLGDDVGIGKTLQVFAVLEHTNPNKVLYFCPAILKHQVKSEMEKFGLDWPVVVIEGNATERRMLWQKEAMVYIANYELLLRDFHFIDVRIWDYIIADESTKISNPFAKQSRLIKRLRGKKKIAMSGSPISNRANELWNILDFCVSGVMGNYFQFVDRYCVKNSWGGIFAYKNMEDLQNRLKRFMIRRTKEQVLPELPEKITSEVPFELSEREKELYKKIKEEILFEIEKTDISKIENPMTIQMTLVKLLRLQQLVDSMELIGEKKQSSKVELLKELLEENLQNNRKALVFTKFEKMATILARELKEYRPVVISGRVSEKDRQEIIRKFNNEEENKVLISTSAGQYGINLQRATIVFHYDQEFSLAKMTQRDGRSHRLGVKDTVFAYHLLAKGTVDYHFRKIVKKKTELSNAILGDKIITMEDIFTILK